MVVVGGNQSSSGDGAGCADGGGNQGLDPDAVRSRVISDLRHNVPRRISQVWMYDARGSELFERITELDEYYLYAARDRNIGKRGW